MSINSDNSKAAMPPSAKELTPLELNAVKLDIKHTILTPSYLEELMGNKTPSTETNS